MVLQVQVDTLSGEGPGNHLILLPIRASSELFEKEHKLFAARLMVHAQVESHSPIKKHE